LATAVKSLTPLAIDDFAGLRTSASHPFSHCEPDAYSDYLVDKYCVMRMADLRVRPGVSRTPGIF
jgi:hypothetical protein